MTEFGVSDSDAQGLIDDYNERIDKPPSETPINLDGLSKVSEVESWLKSNGLVEETVNLEGTSIDEAKGIANGVVKGSKVGENQLKLRSVEIVGGQRTESMGAGYSNGRIVINPKHLNAVREHNREAVESYLGGFRNYAWQAADNAKDALEITLAHEMGHHVETALLLDIQGGYRELIDSGVDLGEEVWARLSGYASTHASEGFAEIHAMITTGREYLVPRELVDAYRAALNTADPEPIAVFLKE